MFFRIEREMDLGNKGIQNFSAREKRVLAGVTEKEIVTFLQRLIKERSTNPPGDTRAAIDVVADLLN